MVVFSIWFFFVLFLLSFSNGTGSELTHCKSSSTRTTSTITTEIEKITKEKLSTRRTFTQISSLSFSLFLCESVCEPASQLACTHCWICDEGCPYVQIGELWENTNKTVRAFVESELAAQRLLPPDWVSKFLLLLPQCSNKANLPQAGWNRVRASLEEWFQSEKRTQPAAEEMWWVEMYWVIHSYD